MAYIAYPPYWKDCMSAVLSKITRRYTDTSRWMPIIFAHIFLIGTLSLTLYMCMYESGIARWGAYGGIAVVVGAWLLFRLLASRFVGYVFSIAHETQAMVEDSVSLWMVSSVLLYVLCCVFQWLPSVGVFRMGVGVIAGMYLVVMSGKVLVSYGKSLKMLFYILLYILTMEIIPLGLVYGAAKSVSQLIQ